VLLLGVALRGLALWVWKQAGFGSLDYAQNLRRLIPAATAIVIGIQTISASFFMSVLGLRTASRKPPILPEAVAGSTRTT